VKKKMLALALILGVGFTCSAINTNKIKLIGEEVKPKVYSPLNQDNGSILLVEEVKPIVFVISLG